MREPDLGMAGWRFITRIAPNHAWLPQRGFFNEVRTSSMRP
jgi:hypothetical protein